MQRLRATIEIHAPVERVYEFVTHPENLPSVWESVVSVSNVERHDDGSHSFDWMHKLGALHVKGHGKTERVEPNELCVVNNTGAIQSTLRWTFDRREGVTGLAVDVAFAISTPIVGRIAAGIVAKHTQEEMRTVLEKMKKALEAPAPQKLS